MWTQISRAVARLLCAVTIALTVVGCAQETLLTPLNWAAPTDRVTQLSDLSYGADSRQKLDVYVPAGRGQAPVILFWHGGSWQRGDKDYYRFVGIALARRGFVAVVPNYRLAPAVSFPVFVQDAALAVKWTLENGSSHRGDVSRLYLSGHSAGGHIALILALDERYLSQVALTRDALAGVISIAGPTGLENLRGKGLKGVFPTALPDAVFSPIDLAPVGASAAPPFLLLSGADDDVVRPESSKSLADAIRDAGGRVATKSYPDTGHLGLLLEFSATFGGDTALLDDIADFAAINP